MPSHLRRFHQSGQSHFVTFSCFHRQQKFNNAEAYELFLDYFERMRRRFEMCIYGYVLMPEHVHLLVNEPLQGTLADSVHWLKLSFAKNVRKPGHEPFWQKRYYDRNIRTHSDFVEKLRYIHRNPVKRGLVSRAEDRKWSSFRHYALREVGMVEVESEWTARDREAKESGVARVFLTPG